MKTYKYLVYPLQFAVCLVTILICSILGICEIIINRPVSAIIFFAIAFLFLIVSFSSGAIITINESGIHRFILGKCTKSLTWNSISEIGVAGSKVLNQKNKNHTGTLYIYISEQRMTEEELFQMMLRWPSKKLFLQYTKTRMDSIQLYWSDKIATYNTGNLRF